MDPTLTTLFFGFLGGIGYILAGALAITVIDDRLNFFDRLHTLVGMLALLCWPLIVPVGALVIAMRSRRWKTR